MRSRGCWLLAILLGAVACGAVPATVPPAATGPSGPSASDRAPQQGSAPGAPSAAGTAKASAPEAAVTAAPARAAQGSIAREHTGQDKPTLAVQNDYLVTQHIFLDQQALGRVPPGSSDTFEVPLGAHTITSADSADPDDNPFSITEIFEPGYGYRYLIRPRTPDEPDAAGH